MGFYTCGWVNYEFALKQILSILDSCVACIYDCRIKESWFSVFLLKGEKENR